MSQEVSFNQEVDGPPPHLLDQYIEGSFGPPPHTLDQYLEGSRGPPPHLLDQYIEGSLREIEAARKALHSPSLSARRNMRKFTDNPIMLGGSKPGRKCLSRTQMTEPYELSQDLLDKQMQVLGGRYGGISMANSAAKTIQRAYRRYNMRKKFAAITSAAHVKTENRLSGKYKGEIQHTVRHVYNVENQERAAKLRVQIDSPQREVLGQVGSAQGGVRGQVGIPQGEVRGQVEARKHTMSDNRGHRGPQPVGHDMTDRASHLYHGCCAHKSPEYKSPYSGQPKVCPGPSTSHTCHTPHNHIGVRPGLRIEDDNHSDAEIQSFPIDYLPERSALACTSGSSLQPRIITSGRTMGPSHAHCVNCGSGQALPSYHSHNDKKRIQDIPNAKRQVSRLTSLDVGESSELYPQPQDSRVKHSSPRTNISNSSSVIARSTSHSKPSQLNKSKSSISSRSKEGTNHAGNEVIRKRHYRTGLNIFNKKPEKGIQFLIGKGFLDNSPQAVARFMITRKGLSKQMIGEYLGNISQSFNLAVTQCFANEMDLSNMQIDLALRKFQTYFRMPGEAQKIERLMEVFSQRYCTCNPDVVRKLNSTDSLFIMAFAIILLNTDLHTPNLKPEKKMKPDDFIRNLRGIDDGCDIDRDLLNGIYDRIRNNEFRPGSDHVTQVMKVQQTIVAKCPNLAVPYRRLVCYCRLYEVTDPQKKDRPGQHQREVFLFNDILVITKIHSRRKNSVTYTFRNSYPLTGLIVSNFENSFYSHGISLSQRWDKKVVITLNARNDHDRSKFVEDLRESIAEMDEMEQLRIESELEKQSVGVRPDRDSGVGTELDSRREEHASQSSKEGGVPVNLRRGAINNSLLDLVDNGGYSGMPDRNTRRGSVGSLDSGMSVSFQSGSAGTVSQDSSPQQKTGTVHSVSLINPRSRQLSAGNQSTNL